MLNHPVNFLGYGFVFKPYPLALTISSTIRFFWLAENLSRLFIVKGMQTYEA
jgi:hypothetical protein